MCRKEKKASELASECSAKKRIVHFQWGYRPMSTHEFCEQ
jgi:hypothetical protein